MRAGWYERGGPAHEVIAVGDLPDPVAGAGEVLVRLHASGINPSDYKRRAGAGPGPRVVPHSDGAGVVAALGDGVGGLAVGQRVWVFNAQHERNMGTAAELIALPAFLVRPLPDNASFNEGACFGIPAMTGHRAVFMDGPVTGQTVYVPGALSRVGAYCVQFAKWGGARVIAAASSDAKADAARELGADAVVRRDGTDAAGLAAQVLDATGGRGVDRVCEIEFGGNMPVNEKILAEGGDHRLLCFGREIQGGNHRQPAPGAQHVDAFHLRLYRNRCRQGRRRPRYLRRPDGRCPAAPDGRML